MAKKDPLSQYESAAEGANLAEAIGRSGASRKLSSRMQRLLEKNPDLDVSGLDIQTFDNWQDMGPGTADAATKALTRMRKKNLRKRGVDDIGRATNRYQLGLNKGIEGVMKRGLQEEIDPSLEAAEDRANQLMNEAAISAEDEAAMRSKIASQVRTAESSRLSRIGSALGIGNVENSPAAAALASRAAEEADRTLVSSLRDLGLQVSQINRQQAGKDVELATRIASQRFNLLNGDAGSLISMRGDIAEMLDALYQRDETISIMRRQAEEAGDVSTMEKIGNWGSLAGSLVRSGAQAYMASQTGGASSMAPSGPSDMTPFETFMGRG